MSAVLKCQLICHTPNPEEVITKAGKLCYSAVGVDEIGEKQTPETAHTTNDVPFVVINAPQGTELRDGDGALCDVAPTVLQLLGIKQPAEMTGKSLIK